MRNWFSRPKKQPKPQSATAKRRTTIRLRGRLKDDVKKAATATGRSMSGQIEHMLDCAFLYERLFGEVEAFKAEMPRLQPRTPPEITAAIRRMAIEHITKENQNGAHP